MVRVGGTDTREEQNIWTDTEGERRRIHYGNMRKRYIEEARKDKNQAKSFCPIKLQIEDEHVKRLDDEITKAEIQIKNAEFLVENQVEKLKREENEGKEARSSFGKIMTNLDFQKFGGDVRKYLGWRNSIKFQLKKFSDEATKVLFLKESVREPTIKRMIEFEQSYDKIWIILDHKFNVSPALSLQSCLSRAEKLEDFPTSLQHQQQNISEILILKQELLFQGGEYALNNMIIDNTLSNKISWLDKKWWSRKASKIHAKACFPGTDNESSDSDQSIESQASSVRSKKPKANTDQPLSENSLSNRDLVKLFYKFIEELDSSLTRMSLTVRKKEKLPKKDQNGKNHETDSKYENDKFRAKKCFFCNNLKFKHQHVRFRSPLLKPKFFNKEVVAMIEEKCFCLRCLEMKKNDHQCNGEYITRTGETKKSDCVKHQGTHFLVCPCAIEKAQAERAKIKEDNEEARKEVSNEPQDETDSQKGAAASFHAPVFLNNAILGTTLSERETVTCLDEKNRPYKIILLYDTGQQSYFYEYW